MKSRNSACAVCLALLVVSLMASSAHSFKQADVDKLLATRECQWCDLRGAHVPGANLSGTDLSGANLTEAQLSDADLSGANLSTAYLRNSDLSGANLSTAFLGKANLSGANVNNANLSGATLTGATWTDGTLCEEGSVGECKQKGAVRQNDDRPTLFPQNY